MGIGVVLDVNDFVNVGVFDGVLDMFGYILKIVGFVVLNMVKIGFGNIFCF